MQDCYYRRRKLGNAHLMKKGQLNRLGIWIFDSIQVSAQPWKFSRVTLRKTSRLRSLKEILMSVTIDAGEFLAWMSSNFKLRFTLELHQRKCTSIKRRYLSPALFPSPVEALLASPSSRSCRSHTFQQIFSPKYHVTVSSIKS